MEYYAGIGSRETPLDKLEDIHWVAKYCESKGIVLRSGGADGADSMFESAVTNDKLKEIYLPWKGFNGNKSSLYRITDESLIIAKKFHPSFDKLSLPARKLMARNTYQVLGYDLNTPSKFIVCWTKGGKWTGGTSQALRIAKAQYIPIINLYWKSANEAIDLIEIIRTIS